MATNTGAPFNLALPGDDDLAQFIATFLNPNLIAINAGAIHSAGAQTLSGQKRYTSSGITLTSDLPALDVALTFNNVAVTMAAARINVTDTASAPESSLLDLQVGGSSRFRVRKDGQVIAAAGLTLTAGTLSVPGGDAHVGGALVVNANARVGGVLTAGKLIGDAVALSIRNAANNQDNLLISDAGRATVRDGISVLAGGANVAGGLTVSGGTVALPAGSLTHAVLAVPNVQLRHSLNHTVLPATETALAFDGEDADTDAMHSTATNNSIITFNTPGTYLISGHVAWEGVVGGTRQLYLKRNGTDVLARTLNDDLGGNPVGQSISRKLDVVAGQYVQLFVYQTSGTNININTDNIGTPIFSAVRIA